MFLFFHPLHDSELFCVSLSHEILIKCIEQKMNTLKITNNISRCCSARCFHTSVFEGFVFCLLGKWILCGTDEIEKADLTEV